MPRIPLKSRRSRTSCSILALATVMAVGATPAAAQSFNGTGVFNSGSGTITTGAGTTNIALTSPTSVITWTPTDNATGTGTNILFQNSGTTATFSRSTDFAVLNKIMPADIARAIVMNGTVNSRVNGVQGGSVYFYSPSGFVLGGTSVFSVGSLVVSALPITVDGSGNFITNPGTENRVTFGQAPNTNATIVSSGTINANIPAFGVGGTGGDSYVALVAPHVVQTSGVNSSISVNGSAALVAAEAATISFSTDGLFDIQVTTGTTSSSGLDINGRIGGPTPVDANDKQGVYLVAVPKNQLLTMVIGSGADLGFTLAGSAAIDDNGVIVLSAGHDIVDGAIGAKSAAPGTGTANFWFVGARARNDLFGEATGEAYLYSAGAAFPTIFNNDVTVHANNVVSMQSFNAGASLTVGGNLSLSTDRTGLAGQSVTAGAVSLFAQNGGTLSIAGTTDLSADAIGGSASVGTAGNGTGGSVSIFANDGSSLTLSNLTTSATGSGGDGLAGGVNAGNGTGGSLSISASNGGAITMNTPLTFIAEGHGGSASGAGLAGNGTGGNASILAGDNSTLTFNGNVTLDASGFGGAHSSGSGGVGTGGVAQTDLLNNATLTINGNLDLNADATGGNGGTGGSGLGGVANIGSDYGPSSGSTMTVSGTTFANANGYGGNANGAGGAGGYGLGGDAFMGGSSNSYTFSGSLTVSAFGSGGSSVSGQGGNADGGVAALDSTGANVHVGDNVFIVADGAGGGGATGGSGAGGFARIRSSNIDIDGSAYLSAGGEGGFGNAGNGGDGSGGTAQLRSQNGSVAIGESVFANANGTGGGSQNSGSTSGNGFGGFVAIEALSNSSLAITNSVLASADGLGGDTFSFGTNGGNGTGGSVRLQANGANANLALGSYADISADGWAGGSCGECGGGGIGGDGIGGDVTVQAFGADTANLSIAGNLWASADGQGGDGFTGDAGDGTGGWVYLGANDGADLHLASFISLSAEGEGGYSFGTGDGGQGVGGIASVNATTGGTVEIDGGGYIDADGYGGGAGIISSGDGGDGTGGIAGIYANGGSIAIGGTIFASGSGEGGFSDNATGGDGLGNIAEVVALNGGDITIQGSVFLEAFGAGGDGYIGGNGTGGGDPSEESFQPGAQVFARNDSSIVIAGDAHLDAGGLGGDGGSNFVSGSNGGAGGGGAGGFTRVTAQNWDNFGSSISVNNIYIAADGQGGAGGAGASGNAGGNGGAGGSGFGGFVTVAAAAGNGTLNANDVFASVSAVGGQGGTGGNGDGQPGGSGGNGGDAVGGSVTVGTVSGLDLAVASNLGSATYNNIFMDASATGGDGGDANFGSTDGTGGNGGNAQGGGATLLVRGSTVNAGDVSMAANATGGSGGFGPGEGATQTGNGGNASVGGLSNLFDTFGNGILVAATDRYLHPDQRGTMNAGDIVGSAVATGGDGATSGSSQTLGGNGVIFRNADGNIGSLDFVIGLGSNPSSAGVDSISIVDGEVVVDGEFSFATSGNLSLFADNGDMHAGTLTLGAGDFVFDPVDDPPSDRGTYFADSATITTGNNFVTSADLVIGSSLAIDAPGLINAHNFGIDGDLDLIAQSGAITANDLYVTGAINLDAFDAINLNIVQAGFFHADAGTFFTSDDITSDSNIQIYAGDDVTLGDLVAGTTADINSNKAIRIDTDGSVLVGNILAAGGIDITAQGSVTGQNVTTGDVLITEANGAISYGNISAGLVNPQPSSESGVVALDSATSISVGNIAASRTIALFTSGALTTLDLTTDTDILGLAHGAISTGDIDAGGRVYLADSSMFTNAGATIGDAGDDTVNPETIFAATPVATGGAITVGDVMAGSFQAAAGTTLTTGTLDTDSQIELRAGGAITTDDITAGDFVLANGGSITLGNVDADSLTLTSTAGNITTGDVFAFGAVEMDAFADILAGDITAGSIDLTAGDDITTGDLTTQQLLLLALNDGPITTLLFPGASITLESGGDISTGNIDSFDGVYANAGGTLHTLNVNAVDFVTLLAGGNMDTDDIVAGDRITLATPGSITTNDINAGGLFLGLAHGNMSIGDVVAGEVFLADFAMLESGGGGLNCIGNCGTLGANGVIVAPPTGSTYQYVSTDGGVDGAGQLPGQGGTDGSLYTTSVFTASAGDPLTFWFNYVTSDGSGFADYAWAALLTPDLNPVAILYTARTQPSGTIVPGQGLPGVTATLDPSSVPIIPGAPAWDPLGTSSNTCYAAGCGYTGWINSTYEIANSGSYVLQFGVTNWQDSSFASGMAFSGITVGGNVVSPSLIPTGGSISIGNVNTGKMSAAAGTTFTGLTIDSTGLVDLSSGGNMQTGNIHAGTSLLADAGGTMSLGALSANIIDLESVGDMSFASANATTRIDMDSDAGLTTGSINSGTIEASAGGTANLNGIWAAPDVSLTSGDIAIGQLGGINAGTGSILLHSSNSGGILLGDGLNGSGWAMSNAEFSLVHGGDITMIAGGLPGVDADSRVGNLTITAGATGNITTPNGGLTIATLSESGTERDGTLRVVGNVVGTGFTTENYLAFATETFELDAATGSISIFSSGSTLGGELGLYADRIHVASGSILDQLAANPTYTGYQQDLNEAAAVQRPEGVLRADTLWIESDNLQDVLIQNTGTSGTPAGFVVREAFINDDSEVAGPPGSINLIVNGQVVTEGGTLTGVEARDALVPEGTDVTPFTSNSTINGCPLTGQCIIVPPAPPPSANVVDNQIDLITGGGLGDGEFGNEDSIDDNDDGDEGANNPISPPQPLFDTRPLIPSSDVNDPVSGTGNPALLGSDSDGECDKDEDAQCGTKKEGGQ